MDVNAEAYASGKPPSGSGTLRNEKPGKAGPYRAKLKDYRSLFVAIDFLTAFMTLLGLDGQRRNRTCIQTL